MTILFAGGFAVSIGAFVTGWWILPSPKRCAGFLCDYAPDAALVLRQHPLSRAQVVVIGGGLAAAVFMSVLGFYRARIHREA